MLVKWNIFGIRIILSFYLSFFLCVMYCYVYVRTYVIDSSHDNYVRMYMYILWIVRTCMYSYNYLWKRLTFIFSFMCQHWPVNTISYGINTENVKGRDKEGQRDHYHTKYMYMYVKIIVSTYLSTEVRRDLSTGILPLSSKVIPTFCEIYINGHTLTYDD